MELNNKMELNTEEIFAKIQNADIQTEPFEHIIIDNLLPGDFYKELSKELDAEDFYRDYDSGGYGNKERFGADITDYGAWAASGRKIPTTIHQGNYNSLLSRNRTNLELFINNLLKNEKEFYSLLCSKLPTEKIQDDYFYHVSMVKDGIGYEVKAHTDHELNIFTILFYAPETDVNKDFGLHVYKEGGDTPVQIGSSHQPGTRNLESGGAIDFMPNRMIIFAPCQPNKERLPTWHEVRRISDKLVGTRNTFQLFFYKNCN